MFYKLNDDGIALPCSLMEWAEFFERDRHKFHLLDDAGPYTISTIFLGLDHGYGGSGDPLIWETMIFDNEYTISSPLWVDSDGNPREIPEPRGRWRFAFTLEAQMFHAAKLAELQQQFADCAIVTPVIHPDSK